MIFFVVLMIFILIVLYWGILKPQKNHSDKKPRIVSVGQQKQNDVATEPEIEQSTATKTPERSEAVKPPNDLVNFHLLNLSDSNKKSVNNILEAAQSLARPHPMINSLSTGMDSPEKLYQLVKSDPEIAAKILQTVNSPRFLLAQKITRLNHAIMYMGTNMVKDIALQCAIGDTLPSEDKLLNRAVKKIWAYGFLASSLAFILATNLRLKNGSELTTKALLAYIGDLAIVSYKPQLAECFIKNESLFDRVTKVQKQLGANSAIVGSRLAGLWDLPEEIIEGISNNLLPMGVAPTACKLRGEDLTNVVFCYLCCRCAEIIINKKLHDIAEVDLFDPDLWELAYLPQYIKYAGLEDFFNLQQQTAFRNEANKFINKIRVS